MKNIISSYVFAAFIMSSSVVFASDLINTNEPKPNQPVLTFEDGYTECGKLITAVNGRREKLDTGYVIQYDDVRYFEISNAAVDSLGSWWTYKAQLNHRISPDYPNKYDYYFGRSEPHCVQFRLKPILKEEFEQYTQVENSGQPVDYLGRPVPNWVCPPLKLCGVVEEIPNLGCKGLKYDLDNYKNLVNVCTIEQFNYSAKEVFPIKINFLSVALNELVDAYARRHNRKDISVRAGSHHFRKPLLPYLQSRVSLGYLDDYRHSSSLVPTFWQLQQMRPIDEQQPLPMEIIKTILSLSNTSPTIDYYLLFKSYAILNPAGVPYRFHSYKMPEPLMWNTRNLMTLDHALEQFAILEHHSYDVFKIQVLNNGVDAKCKLMGDFLLSTTSHNTLETVHQKALRKYAGNVNICVKGSECFFFIEGEHEPMTDDMGVPYVFEHERCSEYERRS